MMDINSKRNLIVLAVVVACFAVLWPKIFYPMILSIVFPFDIEDIEEEIKMRNLNGMLHPQIREAMGEARPLEKPLKERNKIFHPSLRYVSKPQSKGAGAVNLVIPAYTVAIILFFIYAVLKTVFVSRPEVKHSHNRTPLNISCDSGEETCSKRNSQDRKTQQAIEQYGKDKVLTALRTIILEMEDFKGSLNEKDIQETMLPEHHDSPEEKKITEAEKIEWALTESKTICKSSTRKAM